MHQILPPRIIMNYPPDLSDIPFMLSSDHISFQFLIWIERNCFALSSIGIIIRMKNDTVKQKSGKIYIAPLGLPVC